ncbi:MAG TPA: 2-phosphosulfolactate phosphatase [Flexivirga sp.]|uniref:2-phosphosulfolactate phosphatase n=1 Tax=Flexivirga sp. TaxID=1962927 RepID=UPI002C0D8E44|nr:2-phosphosulfolactate phosphatase [Flexivirga sp.]HWC22494.1 2-phosphosulfolactate phosphatase [Flexivirga sp.]
MGSEFGQGAYDVRFEWGPAAARELKADTSVVVDVLSFSTAVTIAVERGMRVYPFRWRDRRAADFAAAHDAALAVGRLEATQPGSVAAPSLSPAGMLTCHFEPRIVLPSPNGSTIAAALQGTGSTVVLGCVRNAGAVARSLSSCLDEGRTVAVIAAGERWGNDDSLRPALEDQLGAGAILSSLRALDCTAALSPESVGAAALFDAFAAQLLESMRDCVSGKELTAKGFAADVEVAAALDASSVVPVLTDGSFGPAGRSPRLPCMH